MGAPITEFMVEQLISTSLEQMRNQPSKLEMIFERLNEGIFAPLFGNKVIHQLRDYVLNRKIAVVQSLQLVPDQAPCYSILINGSTEDSSRSYFDDFNSREDETVEPHNLATITTTAYTASTGFISVGAGTDLSFLYPGAIARDADNVAFDIIAPIIDDASNPLGKGFTIINNATFAVGECVITDNMNVQSYGRRSIPIFDNVQIGVHAADNTNLTKYLYYMLIYFFSSRRIELENAGYQIHSFVASDFIREADLLPNNITSRYVTMKFWVEFTWRDDPWTYIRNSQSKILVQQDVWRKNDDSAIGTIPFPSEG